MYSHKTFAYFNICVSECKVLQRIKISSIEKIGFKCMRLQSFCMKKTYCSYACECKCKCNFCKKTKNVLSAKVKFPREFSKRDRCEFFLKHLNTVLLKPYLKQSAWLPISLLTLQTLLRH